MKKSSKKPLFPGPRVGAKRVLKSKSFLVLFLKKELSCLLSNFCFPLLCWSALSSSADGRTIEAGPGKLLSTFASAVATARDGDTIILSPGRYDECAVLRQNGLTLEGAGGAAAVVIAGTPCQGKALLVIDGAGITIRTLTLADARVADGNGAGIRAEGGALTVQGVRFLHNQDGILTSDAAPSLVLMVRGSFFQGNGACLAACAHAIYAGHIAALRVQGSLFRDTREGHIIKSRALRTEITGCSLTDGPLGTSSYLIEAPDGGALVVRGNVLEKGPRTGNPDAAIAIGLEGADNLTPAITIEGNRATNDGPRRAALVKNWTATVARFSGNKMTGAWRRVTSR